MSAILGVLRFDGGPVLARDIERISKALAHRGPHGSDFAINGSLALGHCLMRVNKEDLFEAQPLRDQDADITLVADARLDNREELASALDIGTVQLNAMPESAIMLRAYQKWGESFVEHLLGDFAFALWDGGAKRLVLGRDHVGQRYVHYHHGRHFFAFATEIKALWSYPDVPRFLSEDYIGRLLLRDRSWRDGETPFNGIRGLTGATVMSVGLNGAVRTRRYWQPHADARETGHDEAYYIEAYRRVLGEAVACRIRRAMRPPGLFFSGGYDSAAIGGLAETALVRSGNKLIAAASVMAADYRGTIRHARPWVEMCARDMPHLDVRYITRQDKNFLTGLETAFVRRELPANSYDFVNDELLSTLASAGAQVVMDGHGGDYTLNPRGHAALARFLATLQIRRFFRELRGHFRLSGHSLWTTLKNDIAVPLLPRAVIGLWRRIRRGVSPLWRDQPISDALAQRLIAAQAINLAELRGAADFERDVRGRMAGVLSRVMNGPAPGNACAAAFFGLELTRPFHDKRVVELALAIPDDLYVKNGRNRYLACAALKDIYPREFQNRWRKNDDEIPDFQRMVKSVEPQILADIAEMEKSEMLTRFIDFAKIRRLLASRDAEQHNSGWEQETQLAAHGFVIARYLKWLGQANR